ncbi:leucine-rich PPR motif-containing protein, mitochondrial [Cephus cinctus]|uniref:Leucine-rich PPR motif-containing protein, mitochondrial n=1 Tax=Cephus cinctus TaxID=211228 RepID=A0AAJ7FCE4_CEPCN|nr:leucine-rich PPR motif-containing protein, mitochondrial [Cephus cinctus]
MALLRKSSRILLPHTRFGVACQLELSYCVLNNLRKEGYVRPCTVFMYKSIQYNTYSTLTKNIKATNITAEKQLELALISLCSRMQKNQVRYQDLIYIIQCYENNIEKLNKQNLLILLQCCGDMLPYINLEIRRKLTDRVWQLIQSENERLTLENYKTLLRIYGQNYSYVDPKRFLESMDVEPDEETYQLLLNATSKTGNYELVATVISQMKNEVRLNEETLNALVLVHSINGDIENAKSIFSTMKTEMIGPSKNTYANLAYGYAKIGLWKNLQELMETNKFDTVQIMCIVKTLSFSDHGIYIPEVLQYLETPIDPNDPYIINTVIELTHAQKIEDGYKIIDFIPISQQPVNQVNTPKHYFLYELVNTNTPIGIIISVANKLVTSGKIPTAFLQIAEIALRLKAESVALAMFELLKERGIAIKPHFYWPLLLKASNEEGEAKILQLIDHMQRMGANLDYDTLSSYIFPYMNLSDPIIALRKIQDKGVTASYIITPLLSVLLVRGEVFSASMLLKTIKCKIDHLSILKQLILGYKISKDINNCTAILKLSAANFDFGGIFLQDLISDKKNELTMRELSSFIKSFKIYQLFISSTSGKIIKNKIMELSGNEMKETSFEMIEQLVDPTLDLPNTDHFTMIPHPSQMTTEELENHLTELRTKGLNTRGVLRKLLQSYCTENNLQRAQEIRAEFDENGFNWTPGMRSALFDLYSNNGMINEAQSELTKLKVYHTNFQIDDQKILNYATVLVNQNNIQMALNLLNDHKVVKDDSNISKNCWQFLNTVAHKNPDHVEKLFNLLISKHFCKINNGILGPLIRVHLLKNDVVSAVETFKKLEKNYQKVPLLQEIMMALISSSDKTWAEKQLQEVYDIAKKIVNIRTVNASLLVALAKCKKFKEIHNLLRTQGISEDKLSSALTFVPEETKLPILFTILEASRGIPDTYINFIYNLILSVYSRAGDYEGAMTLWEKMISEDIPPTKWFRDHFIELLSSHKIELPQDFPVKRYQDEINRRK